MLFLDCQCIICLQLGATYTLIPRYKLFQQDVCTTSEYRPLVMLDGRPSMAKQGANIGQSLRVSIAAATSYFWGCLSFFVFVRLSLVHGRLESCLLCRVDHYIPRLSGGGARLAAVILASSVSPSLSSLSFPWFPLATINQHHHLLTGHRLSILGYPAVEHVLSLVDVQFTA